MIYDKPRDINLRVFPSLSSFAPKKSKSRSAAEQNVKQHNFENSTKEPLAVNASKLGETSPEKPMIAISEVPIVGSTAVPESEGNTIITERAEEKSPLNFVKASEIPNKPIIDISKMPDIEGIPLLKLPDEILPEIAEEKELDAEVYEPLEKAPEKEIKAPPFRETEVEITQAEFPKKVKEKKSLKPKKKHRKKTETDIFKVNKSYLTKAAVFFVMLYIGATLAFIIPLRPSYSETEKRNLAQFPKFSAKTLVDGSYFYDIGTWFSDTFPYREALTKANTKLKSFYGFDTVSIHGDVEQGDEIPDVPPVSETETTKVSPTETTQPVKMPDADDLQSDNGDPDAQKPDIKTESLGAIIVAGNTGYEYYNFSNSLAPRFINSVNNIKSALNCDSDVYAMIIPTSIDITLNDALRADIKSANQKKALDYFNASFKNVTAVDGIYEAERLHRNEYIYFRTDHHWTALGAYYAYCRFAEAKGIDAVPLQKYQTKTFDGFLGTFYSGSGQASKLGETPDSVTAYMPYNNITCRIDEGNGNAYDWDVVKDVSDYSQSLKYLAFIGGDNALTTVTNADNPNGETCIVIKESYGNAFVPFLIPHYSTVYVIDPRHYKGTLGEFTKDKNIDDVIFLANISTTRNNVYIEAMEDFIK